MASTQVATIKRDTIGNIIVDEDGYVTCISEGGLQFQILYNEIDFNCDSMNCTFDNIEMYIRIHDNVPNHGNIPIHDNVPNHGNILSNVTNQQSSNENSINKTEVRRGESFVWTDATTKLFLSLYKEKRDCLAQRKIKTKKILWQKISEDMKLNGYYLTMTQVENKYKSLERAYKNAVTHNKQTGRNRLSCPYETELTELLGDKHSIEPLCVSGNKGVIAKRSNHDNERATTPLSGCDANSDTENVALNTNILNETPKNQSSIMRKGATARLLETCKTNLEQLTDDIREESKTRSEVLQNMLQEYKEMRKSWIDEMQKSHEQMKIGNNLREERNQLLRKFLRKKEKE